VQENRRNNVYRFRAVVYKLCAASTGKCSIQAAENTRILVYGLSTARHQADRSSGTFGELLAAEAGAVVDRSPEDLREVGNYIVALEHGMAQRNKLPLCIRLIRELHGKLMTDVRGEGDTGRVQKVAELDWEAGEHVGNRLLHPTSAR
jgi:hypothetical protein